MAVVRSSYDYDKFGGVPAAVMVWLRCFRLQLAAEPCKMLNVPKILLELLLLTLAVPTVSSSAYLLVLTLLSQRLRPPGASSRQLRFDLIVPAHNEAGVIERT